MNFKKLFLLLPVMLTLIVIPVSASANIVWPSLYIAEGMHSWYVILCGILIEGAFIKIFTKKPIFTSLGLSVVMNAISTLVGIILIPFAGFFGAISLELLNEVWPIFGGTFGNAQWVLGYIITVFANVLTEGLALKFTGKLKFTKTFWWLLGANAISVIICILFHGFYMGAIK